MFDLKLMSHELDAAHVIHSEVHSALFDSMGLGKTVSCLEALKMAPGASDKAFKCICCVPNTIIGQWVYEIDRWLSWETTVAVGNREFRHQKYEFFEHCDHNVILITSYSILRKDEFFKSVHADFLILDEAYLFRNKNKLYWYLKDFVSQFDRVCLLSGNIDSFTEVQLANIHNLLYGSAIKRISKEEFLLKPGIVSRESVKFLDSCFDYSIQNVELPISSDQKQWLETLCVEERRSSKNSASHSPLKFVNWKRKVLLSPRLKNLKFGKSPKEIYCLNTILKSREKFIVYVSDVEFYELIKNDLLDLGIKCAFVNGKMSLNLRDRNISLFVNDDSVQVLLLSGVGKFGLNLQVCHNVIYLGVPSNSFEIRQLIGRVCRIGQFSKVVCTVPYHTGEI